MRCRYVSIHALATLVFCPAAFAQSKPPPDAEAWREDEGELVDPDDLAPSLLRSTERAAALPVQLSFVAWREDATPFAVDRGVGIVLTFPFERAFRPAPLPRGRALGPAGVAAPTTHERAGAPGPLAPPGPDRAPTPDGPAPADQAPSPDAPPPPDHQRSPAGAAPLPLERISATVAPLPFERFSSATAPLPFERFSSATAPLPFERALGPGVRSTPALPAPSPLVAGGALAAVSTGLSHEASLADLHVPAAQVRALTDAALRGAGLAASADGRLDGLASRSRSSALLPELRLRGVQSNDRALRLSYTEADPYRTQTSGGSALLFEARATWRLDRLLYADDEVAVERLRGDVREQRQRLLLKVVEAIAAWQKAQLVLLDPEAAPRERSAALGQAEGAAVLLDALSAGAWSRLRGRDAGGAGQR